MSYQRAQKPDAQPFDEIRLVTVPRFKQSVLSGDEWRISIVAQFFRKGIKVHEETCGRNMEKATAILPWLYLRACDDGKGYFAGERDVCDQEGCSKQAVVAYARKREHARDRPHEWSREDGQAVRLFCSEHRTRGDSCFDDMDDNYEQIDMAAVK